MAPKDRRLAIKALRLAHRTRPKRAREHPLLPDTSMPFTVGYLQHILKAMGHKVGEHRAAKMIHELRRLNYLSPKGSYRAKTHGYRVTLYRTPRFTCSVRRRKEVKRCTRRNWWAHSLFGTPDGLPPPL